MESGELRVICFHGYLKFTVYKLKGLIGIRYQVSGYEIIIHYSLFILILNSQFSILNSNYSLLQRVLYHFHCAVDAEFFEYMPFMRVNGMGADV